MLGCRALAIPVPSKEGVTGYDTHTCAIAISSVTAELKNEKQNVYPKTVLYRDTLSRRLTMETFLSVH